MPAALGVAFLLIPLFPAFITLTGVSVPGISLVPASLTLALVGGATLIAFYGAARLVSTPGRTDSDGGGLRRVAGRSDRGRRAGLRSARRRDLHRDRDFRGGAACDDRAVLRAPHVEATIYAAFLASGAIAALAAILMVVAKAPADLYTVGHGRAIGTFILPGELAGYLIMYVPFAYAIARVTERRDLRLVAYAGAILGAIAFVLTFFARRMDRNGGGDRVFRLHAAAPGSRPRRGCHRGPGDRPRSGWSSTPTTIPRRTSPASRFGRRHPTLIARFPLSGVGPFDFATIYQWVRLPDASRRRFTRTASCSP